MASCDIANMKDVEGCSDCSSEYDGWNIICINSKDRGLQCQLCSCLSSDESHFKSASPSDKYGGKVPWLEYSNSAAKKERRVKGRKCLTCAMVWKLRGRLGESVLLRVVSVALRALYYSLLPLPPLSLTTDD